MNEDGRRIVLPTADEQFDSMGPTEDIETWYTSCVECESDIDIEFDYEAKEILVTPCPCGGNSG